MSRQLELLPRPGLEIHPEPGRTAPRFWVRRLVIWEKPGKVLREIALRPGLNIIWSPDPADSGHASGTQTALGHGSGKTLFCRLFRYALGEDRFCPEDQRHRIARAYPEGMVGTEIMVDGTQWAVVRPIGASRQHYAVPDVALEQLLNGEIAATGILPFLKAMESVILSESVAALIPVEHTHQAWLVALAWLSRDQECRFDKVLDWRSPDSDSDSPARGLSSTKILDALRALIGAIDPEEHRLRSEIGEMESRQKEFAQEAARLGWVTERLQSRLTAELGLDPSELLAGRLSVEPLRQAAKSRLAQLAKVSPEVDVTDLDGLRSRTDEATQHVESLKRAMAETEARIPEITALIQRIKGERPGISVEIDNRTNPLCPVCDVPISHALAEGCKLSRKLPDLAAAKQRLEQLKEEQAMQESRLQDNQWELDRLQKALVPALAQADSLQRQLRQAERNREARSDAWFTTRRLLADADRLDADILAHEKKSSSVDELAQQIEKKREQTAAFRDAQAKVFERLTRFFDAIIREIVGAGASGRVALDGNGLKLSVELGGERSTAAIDSLKVIAFDLAVMCMSIEGGIRLPAFLIHDSPREADLGLSVYHRLFHLVRGLESPACQPLFQYVVTTTTHPPDGLKEKPWLCESLGGSPASKRLMKCDL